MGHANDNFRLGEDHIIIGLKGKVESGKYVRYDNRALYDIILEHRKEFPYKVIVEGNGKHTGEYRMEDKEEVIELIEKILASKAPDNIYELLTLDTFSLESHKGKYSFAVTKQTS